MLEFKAAKNKPSLGSIAEERHDFGEGKSTSSFPSAAIDDIVGRNAADPRQAKLASMK